MLLLFSPYEHTHTKINRT